MRQIPFAKYTCYGNNFVTVDQAIEGSLSKEEMSTFARAAIHTSRQQVDSSIRLPTLAATDEEEQSTNATILLVEDLPINREVEISALALLGYKSAMSYNGREALDKLEEEDFDLVLTDCQMPKMDGFEAIQRIREREACEHQGGRIPIVALTANALKGDQERCLKAGMDDYLAKPFNKEQRRQMLNRWLLHKLTGFVGAKPSSENDIAVDDAGGSDAVEEHSRVLDPDTLDMLREIDAGGDFLLRLITAFLDKTPMDVDQIKRAVEASDATALRLAALPFKCSSRNLGDLAVASLCESLETNGREDDISKAPKLVERLDVELEHAFAALKGIQSDPQRNIC